jgi:hypothetical protein
VHQRKMIPASFSNMMSKNHKLSSINWPITHGPSKCEKQ